jgi:hypothetical protein
MLFEVPAGTILFFLAERRVLVRVRVPVDFVAAFASAGLNLESLIDEDTADLSGFDTSQPPGHVWISTTCEWPSGADGWSPSIPRFRSFLTRA